MNVTEDIAADASRYADVKNHIAFLLRVQREIGYDNTEEYSRALRDLQAFIRGLEGVSDVQS